ncbi:sel1 repeat family protein [Helicobacter sp. MIT 01-3238]|nr:sel1 repeat family protein [Helicobacter sp. MIT 01-3238]
MGDNRASRVYSLLAGAYYKLQDYYNAKKYYEIACNKGNDEYSQAEDCYNLGVLYNGGQGVRQDYYKAHELWKKACDMKYGFACNNLGVRYINGQGVRQNSSTAKQYFGKACDLGSQNGCDNYRKLNNQGVQ